MDTHKILVADPISEKGIAALEAEPLLEVIFKPGLSEDELVEAAADCSGIIVRSGVNITERIIAAAPKLKAIGRAGVGVDNIDIPAATKHGVVVMNTPAGNTISTAEHAFALMTSLARHIPRAHRSVVDGNFKEGRKANKGVELYNKTLAVIGMGRIGTEFAKRAMAFGMRVVAYDPYLAANRAKLLRVELCDTVDAAVEQADFITLHMPKTEETTHLINAARIAKMKDGVRIINCARGGLIDEKALLAGLESGKIAGAGLDVYETEPPAADDPLICRPDVVLTPHLGASTEEAQENVGIEIAHTVRDCVLHGSVVNAINMPNIDEKTLAVIGPHLNLAEVLGKLAAQLAPNQPEYFRINYSGSVADLDTNLITRGALKGFFEVGSCADSVNHLNAPGVAEDRGIRVIESRVAEPGDFSDLIELVVGNDSDKITVAGTFFGSQPRIVKIHNRLVEVAPNGHLLVYTNDDTPGMIGHVGKLLGDHGINIASMNLNRDSEAGTALSVLSLDSSPGEEAMAAFTALDGIHEARAVKL